MAVNPRWRNVLYETWKTEHRGKRRGRDGPVFKRKHRWFLAALIHALAMREKYDDQSFVVYACQWMDDPYTGGTAKKHWHVGSRRYHPPGSTQHM